MMNTNYREAIEANIQVHSAMADKYNEVEPHFRSESVERVKSILDDINKNHNISKALDLGCGTGFMINERIYHRNSRCGCNAGNDGSRR